jgi:hypothetical protein
MIVKFRIRQYLKYGNMSFGIWQDYLIVRCRANRYEECLHANEMTTTTKPQRWIENVVLEELIKSIEALRLKITLRIRLNLFKE